MPIMSSSLFRGSLSESLPQGHPDHWVWSGGHRWWHHLWAKSKHSRTQSAKTEQRYECMWPQSLPQRSFMHWFFDQNCHAGACFWCLTKSCTLSWQKHSTNWTRRNLPQHYKSRILKPVSDIILHSRKLRAFPLRLIIKAECPLFLKCPHFYLKLYWKSQPEQLGKKK